MIRISVLIIFSNYLWLISCQAPQSSAEIPADSLAIVQPVFVTDTVLNDSDDPAIWINYKNPSESLIIGTDKGGDASEGGLHVFNLQGKELIHKRIQNLKRPNNVDVAYGLSFAGGAVDIAVCTERNTNKIRVFKLPEMTIIDNGGISVFDGDSLRSPMGVALYTAPDSTVYAIVGRKVGPSGTYLWQYRLVDDGKGRITGEVVRKFGAYSGKNEIESIAVDNALGFIYYSDEGVGVRKYYAHPDSTTNELALFAITGFSEDHEGISIYKKDKGTGYIIVSDQGANQFHVFPREGSAGDRHQHPLLKIVKVTANNSDGSDVSSFALPGFPNGIFIAMSDNKTFEVFDAGRIVN